METNLCYALSKKYIIANIILDLKTTKVIQIKNLNVEATNCKFCGSPYEYNFITYNHLGNFKCSRCDFKREELDFSVADILENNINESIIKIKNNVITINQGGIYNIYNVLCAYAISSVCNIPDYIIIDSIKTFSNVFGRQENFKIKNNDITMFLVKPCRL